MSTLFGGGDELVPVRELEPGERITLRGDVIAEVAENPRDGMWIVVRYLETPAGLVADERIEMVSADDVVARIGK